MSRDAGAQSRQKSGLVFLDHVFFKLLAKLGFPLVAVLFAPRPVRLTHFPIGAHHRVAVTVERSPRRMGRAQRNPSPLLETCSDISAVSWRILDIDITANC